MDKAKAADMTGEDVVQVRIATSLHKAAVIRPCEGAFIENLRNKILKKIREMNSIAENKQGSLERSD
jgi:hypothetical protein